ncbi:MAG: ferredoxin family protein [Deltaproteobacteria bacterium]|nr:ferredoxin family protein [Deltaproteobacteria bacterium]
MTTTKSKTGRIVIDSEVCKGCYLCISVCPNKLIVISEHLNEKGYHPAVFINSPAEGKPCSGCALCALVCPDVAIEVYRE